MPPPTVSVVYHAALVEKPIFVSGVVLEKPLIYEVSVGTKDILPSTTSPYIPFALNLENIAARVSVLYITTEASVPLWFTVIVKVEVCPS